MPVAAKVRGFLEDNGVSYEVLEHETAFTAQEVAAATHVSGRELAKCVIVTGGEAFAMAVLPASRAVDLRALSRIAGRKLRLASEDQFAGLFPGSDLGAMAPLGNLYDVPVYVDDALAEDEEIAFNAGSHRHAIKMRYADYERLVAPVVAAFSKPYQG